MRSIGPGYRRGFFVEGAPDVKKSCRKSWLLRTFAMDSPPVPYRRPFLRPSDDSSEPILHVSPAAGMSSDTSSPYNLLLRLMLPPSASMVAFVSANANAISAALEQMISDVEVH